MLDTLYGSDTVPLPSRCTFQRLVKAVRAQHGGSHGVTVIDEQGVGNYLLNRAPRATAR
ncbi:hypothetical protein [Streptomyces sp. NPDC058678]|uniref:hypothetical protein n=1 Tax=Streptomyces sp. NPDC058678 TaxID=3346595 RepID=UPI00364FB207